MCTLAPTYAVPGGLLGADAWRTMVPAATQGSGYADDNAAAGFAADLPTQSESSFIALPGGYRYCDFDFGAVLRGLRSLLHVPAAARLAPRSMDADDDDATPKTPVAVLSAPITYGDEDAAAESDAVTVKSTTPSPKKKPRPQEFEHDASIDATFMDADDAASPKTPRAVLRAPLSYGDDDAAAEGDAATVKTSPVAKKQPQGFEYDASIDATFRDMETRHEERPSADYLRDTQEGSMTMADRAELIAKMHHFFRNYDLAPAALHRAVFYVDRFLSAKKFSYGDRESRLLGAAAVFAAAKYEDQNTVWEADADSVAGYAGCTRREVVDVEVELLAALGYRLSGPTAYTFIDHFTRNIPEEDEGAALVRSLAHHLADMALLDYRCVAFLPSAVAASAIYLATLLTLGYSTAPVAGYELEDLSDCMEAIYDMHENRSVWPGCDQMMTDWEASTGRCPYSLPPRHTLKYKHVRCAAGLC